MIERILAATVLALLLPLCGVAQTHSNFPVDIVVGPAPQPVVADGRARLAYELHVTNFAPFPIELTGIDVRGQVENPLASYYGEALDKMVVPAQRVVVWGPADGAAKARVLGEGHSAVIFFDLTLEAGVPTPAALRHRFSFSFSGKNGGAVDRTVDAPVVSVIQEQELVLRPPLHGARWIAFNAFSNGASPDHRRAANAVDGRVYIAQRFAIDWMRLGPEGRLFHGDSKSNVNFYGYGVDVLAVADGQVADLKDGLPDNVGDNERSKRVVTLDNVVGNYLTLDLGHGRFVLYAHLQPGSLKVKLGDKVRAGVVLARLGNSGNSDAPHLHIQMTDSNSPMAAEGIPYELETFSQLGVIDDPAALDAGQPWKPKPNEKPVVHRGEFPVDKSILTFP